MHSTFQHRLKGELNLRAFFASDEFQYLFLVERVIRNFLVIDCQDIITGHYSGTFCRAVFLWIEHDQAIPYESNLDTDTHIMSVGALLKLYHLIWWKIMGMWIQPLHDRGDRLGDQFVSRDIPNISGLQEPNDLFNLSAAVMRIGEGGFRLLMWVTRSCKLCPCQHTNDSHQAEQQRLPYFIFPCCFCHVYFFLSSFLLRQRLSLRQNRAQRSGI